MVTNSNFRQGWDSNLILSPFTLSWAFHVKLISTICISQSPSKLLNFTFWFFIVNLILLVILTLTVKVLFCITIWVLAILVILCFFSILSLNSVSLAKFSPTFLNAIGLWAPHHDHLWVNVALSYLFRLSPWTIFSLSSWNVGLKYWEVYLPLIIVGPLDCSSKSVLIHFSSSSICCIIVKNYIIWSIR